MVNMAKKEMVNTNEFWQPATLFLALLVAFFTIYASSATEDIKLFAVNLTITGLLAVYVFFVIRPKLK